MAGHRANQDWRRGRLRAGACGGAAAGGEQRPSCACAQGGSPCCKRFICCGNRCQQRRCSDRTSTKLGALGASPCPASPPAPCPRPARVRSPAVKQPIADVLPVKRASSGHLHSTLALPAARYGAHKTPTAHANQSDAHILAVPDAGLSLWTCAQAQRNMHAAPHSVSCQPPRCSAPPANSPPTTAQARPLPGARLGDRVAADRQAELQAAKAAAAGQRLAQRQHRERGPDHDLHRPDVVHVQAELRPPCARSQCAGCHTRCGARRRRPCTMPGRSACQCSLGLRVHARQSNHRDWTGGYAPQALAHVAWMQMHGSKWQS